GERRLPDRWADAAVRCAGAPRPRAGRRALRHGRRADLWPARPRRAGGGFDRHRGPPVHGHGRGRAPRRAGEGESATRKSLESVTQLLPSDAPLARSWHSGCLSLPPLGSDGPTKKEATKMELSAFLSSDAALVLFSGFGLVATGLAIIRDIPVQRRVA